MNTDSKGYGTEMQFTLQGGNVTKRDEKGTGKTLNDEEAWEAVQIYTRYSISYRCYICYRWYSRPKTARNAGRYSKGVTDVRYVTDVTGSRLKKTAREAGQIFKKCYR